jgi:hypothetical protein
MWSISTGTILAVNQPKTKTPPSIRSDLSDTGTRFSAFYRRWDSLNNNTAERALRHLAVQRKISGAFSKKGAIHYLRLLAVAQTCRFQSKSFLGFLTSGCVDLDKYDKGCRRRAIEQLDPITGDE